MKHTNAIILAAAACLAGCVNTSPGWDSSFGDAARQARALQLIDPDAPSRNTGAPLADGKAVAGAQKAYAKSYGYAVEEPKQPGLVISNSVGR